MEKVKQSEAQVTGEIASLQSKYGLVLFRNQRQIGKINGSWTATGFMNGASDLIGYQRSTGRFVAVEVKATGKKPTKEQQAFIDALNMNGCIALWADSAAMFIDKIERVLI
jgi:hypothetical protein